MPRYDYECCGKKWEEFVSYDNRDRVLCDVCNSPGRRLVSLFNPVGLTYVGTSRFKGAEFALGKQGLESTRDVERAMADVGAVPVDAYYRPPAPPPPKEITMEEVAPYLDGMPL